MTPIITPTPSITVSVTDIPPIDPTAGWKTYTNTALGFELKYPPTVKIDKEMNDQFNRATTFIGDSLNFEVMLRKTDDISLDKYYYMDNPTFSKSVLGGKDANVYVFDASKNSCVSDGTGPGCPLSYVTYVAQNGSDLYHLGFFGVSSLSDIEEKILSTFKLSTSGISCQYNGKTYQDGESFPDSCNSCSCESGKIACTTMACP